MKVHDVVEVVPLAAMPKMQTHAQSSQEYQKEMCIYLSSRTRITRSTWGVFYQLPLGVLSGLLNPLPSPGIRLGAVHGRQEASGDAQAAPVGLWKRSPASRTRLSVPYNPY